MIHELQCYTRLSLVVRYCEIYYFLLIGKLIVRSHSHQLLLGRSEGSECLKFSKKLKQLYDPTLTLIRTTENLRIFVATFMPEARDEPPPTTRIAGQI